MSRGKPKEKEAVQGAEKVTAVVVADTFTHDFKPLTTLTPRALVPLANVPVIDYTIEFLVLNGVEEIFVLCASHAEQLQEHLRGSRWAHSNEVHLRVLVAQCENPGDAIRHLNDYDVLRHDFILISADVVTNFANLKLLLKRHKERREVDPAILLTLVFREEEFFMEADPAAAPLSPILPPTSPTWAVSSGQPLMEEYVTAILEPVSGILHSCQPWVSRSFACNEDPENAEEGEVPRYLTVDLKLLKDNPSLVCRSDLIDTNIVICSLEVLSLFKQEFDFFDIKHDCVQSILEHDILGNKMAADIIRAPFFGRVVSFNHYAAMSQAVLGRWLHPMVPENNFGGKGQFCYAPHENNVYLGTGAKVCRGVKLGCDVMVGPDTVIESGSALENCTVGSGCRIGKNVRIVNSYVWDDVHIGDGCLLTSCVVASGARILPNATVSSGTVVAQGVVVGTGHATTPNTRLHLTPTSNPRAVGPDGQGDWWTPLGPELRFLDVHTQPRERGDDEDSLDDGFEELLGTEADTAGLYAKAGRVRRPVEEALSPEQNFFLEMQQLVHRALRENHQHDNSMLEIKALKFAYNRSFQDCVRGTVRGFVTYFDDGVRSSKEFKDDVLRVLKKCGETASRKAEEGWTSVFRKFVAAETDCEVQLEMLEELVDLAKKRKVMQSALVHLLMFFHQEDVLSGEGILRWVAQVDQRGTAEERAIRAKCDRFIEWLQQGDEEEEGDDNP